MKRRRLLQSILGAPAALAVPLPAQERKIAEETPKLAISTADAAAATVPRFFAADDLAALDRLGELLMPAGDNIPGAREAGAAGFLDFLISQSPSDRQALYREGVGRLNREARARYAKPFSALATEEAAPILAPLRDAWTYQGPSDGFARFLRAAKDDIWQATVSSRPWAEAMSSRSRGAAGLGLYWLPME
ncbi:MAG: gluconate 2-dehydrogenase subunit 3 family protein [Acidobacteria bacterium]|nr:gluconate 2-dehydrogenase subunit 3 family protein [Acidobacteriota bacterium]